MLHGRADLPLVHVDDYGAPLLDSDGGYLGDRARSAAFDEALARVRHLLLRHGHHPADLPRPDRDEADEALDGDEPIAREAVHAAIEAYARELAYVTGRLLALPAWRGTECIVVGGGLRDSRVGELAIARGASLLKEGGTPVAMRPIRHDPDEAGLLGGVHLLPAPVLRQADAILAADIGGSNIRVGIVRLGDAPSVHETDRWKHREDRPDRDEAVARLARMLGDMADVADRDGLRLAGHVAIGCPGAIGSDGAIRRGGQNLPGDWEEDGFLLPRALEAHLRGMQIVLHNDAVVQGLSEAGEMREVPRWAVLTIGTGLGNARFTSRAGTCEDPEKESPPGVSGGQGYREASRLGDEGVRDPASQSSRTGNHAAVRRTAKAIQ